MSLSLFLLIILEAISLSLMAAVFAAFRQAARKQKEFFCRLCHTGHDYLRCPEPLSKNGLLFIYALMTFGLIAGTLLLYGYQPHFL